MCCPPHKVLELNCLRALDVSPGSLYAAFLWVLSRGSGFYWVLAERY
jgi:hypothetical protein